MKPYETLTYIGRLRRMRQLAQVALQAYGVVDATFKLVVDAGNTLYRVYTSQISKDKASADLFGENQYLLRIHSPSYQAPDAIELELAWLSAMRHEAGLPVPEPIPCLDGKWLSQVAIPGTGQIRNCSLLRWVKGRNIVHRARAHHFRAQGQLMARMHNFTQQWLIPPGHTKRHYDWDGLFMNDAEIGLPAGESWKLLPQPWVEPFEIVAKRFRQLTEAWGKGPEVYGLIHADMGMDANILFWHGEPHPIDFDGSGFGYWMYDLFITLEHARGDPAFPGYREALLDGYTGLRPVSDEQLAQIDLFLAVFSVYWDLWAVGGTYVHPEFLAEYRPRIHREAELVINYVSIYP